MTTMNCWEYTKCGREPSGAKANELGICPASQESALDGVNSGANAGRSCWLVKSTLCKSQIQGDFFGKLGNCMKCHFLKTVFKEEKSDFTYGMKYFMEFERAKKQEG